MSGLSLAEFADKVGEIMPVISRQFLKDQTKDFYKMKMTIPQLVLLDLLSRHGESNMSELARLMSVTTAAMTGVADRLVRDGYILRVSDPKDRRVVKVKLTAKGSGMVEKAGEHKKKIMMRIFGIISEKERGDYLKILTHIQKHIEEANH